MEPELIRNSEKMNAFFANRGRAVLTLVLSVAIWQFLGDSAWAQFQRPRPSFFSADVFTLIRWAGVALSILLGYLVSFHLVFPTLLRKGLRPLRAYGLSWDIFFLLATAATVVLLWTDLTPDKATRLSSALYLYKNHFLVMAVGLVLALIPLVLFRPSRS